MLSNAAGIGGGSIMVPVFIYMFNFASIESIPLSKITMLAGAIANLVLTFNQRLPKEPNHLLIDFSAAAALTPLMLSGTQIGVLLQKWLPPAAVMFGLTVLVVYTLIKMYKSGVNAFKKESVEIEMLRKMQNESKFKDGLPSNDIELIPQEEEAVQTALLGQEQAVPRTASLPSIWTLYLPHWKNILILCISISIILLTALLRGGESFLSLIGIDSCSIASTSILIFSQLINCLLSWYCFKLNESQGLFSPEMKKISGKLAVVLLYSYCAGIAAGLFGLGGGLVLGVYLISIGLNPEFCTALTGFTLLWVASSTSVQYTIIGALHLKHAFIFMVISLLGSFIGNLILRGVVRKYNRPSILIWTIFLLMIISGIVIPYDVVMRSIKNPKYALNFGSYC